MEVPSSFDHLQTIISGRESQVRVKFCAKLWLVLEFAQHNPDLVPQLGVSWLPDKTSFAINTAIFCQAFGFKQNTVNTNLRTHFFEIRRMSVKSLQDILPKVPQVDKWKVRYNPNYSFTPSSNLSNINMIPCRTDTQITPLSIATTPSPHTTSAYIPTILLPHFKSHKDTETHVIRLMKQVFADSIDQSQQFLRESLVPWISKFRSLTPADPEDVVELIISASSTPINHFNIRKNILYLLSISCGSSQIIGTISLSDYLAFLLRFGPLNCATAAVADVSAFSHSELAAFQQWFLPSTDRACEMHVARQQQWFVRLSKSRPCNFIYNNGGSCGTEIRHSCLGGSETRFSVTFEVDGLERYASSLTELLSNVLHKNLQFFGATVYTSEPIRMATADAVAVEKALPMLDLEYAIEPQIPDFWPYNL